ncbi:helix-turn-helix domain-containing protein [Novosphingobium sp. Leaf2]|uniref:helix-turn-helix domain-containing protein n=1 Tax=Novosphingobium sp. Leaf2 TaxID=1735670 RepID=UPI00070028C6|nr:helix-turn-helix domain-containing protein [Novosphingobium sp. Leaf2]KQM19380.1 XRE family transcriptional regulator [Novosphingobium sp. Leaf2]
MINRIRDIRLQKGLTLADVAAACTPPTTAQTIGRLETGMRNLSLVWMNRIAAALQVEPETLLRSDNAEPARLIASLGSKGPEALRKPIDAVLPSDLSADAPWLVLAVDASQGEYREGDQVWLRQHGPEQAGALIDRDVLAPLPAGRFAFGRLITSEDGAVTLLPPASGRERVTVAAPAWLAVAETLVRKL